MADRLGDYLNNFKKYFEADSQVGDNISQELRAHLEEKTQELKEKGFGEEEATKIALDSLGSPQFIARQMYEVYNQGTWGEAFFAALPHFLMALLFASYYWQNIAFVSVILIATACVVVYGWCHEKPIWFFPWLGYYLLPVIIGGILLIYLLQGWTWLVAVVYIPLALFTLTYILKQTASRDWLYVSLVLTPLPVVLGWLLSLGLGSESIAIGISLGQLGMYIPWIVSSFLVLAVATVGFVRLRQRWCKTAVLLIPPIMVLSSIALAAGGSINLLGWLILFFSLAAVISPAWLQYRFQ